METKNNNGESLSRAFSENPIEEKQPEYFNEGSAAANKNYVFNNCSVTINEEGEAIGILKHQEVRKSKMQEAQMQLIGKVVEGVTSAISSFLSVKTKDEDPIEQVKAEFKKPARKRASAKKQAPAKKVVVKKAPAKKAAAKKATKK